MFDRSIAQEMARERQREIERRLRLRRELGPRPARPPIRSVVGHGLVRIGSRLAADGPLEPAPGR